MPPPRQPHSLLSLSLGRVRDLVCTFCRSEHAGARGSQFLKEDTLTGLPTPLLEQLIGEVTNVLINRSKETKHFFTAFKCFPLSRISRLDFSRVFHGFRLSRAQNLEFQRNCLTILAESRALTHLAILGKCTNPMLQTLGDNCPHLRELNVSLSDAIDSEGLSYLVPTADHVRCGELVMVDLTRCWNISPDAAAVLVQGLPRLRRLAYQNMRRVIALLLQHQQQQPDGVKEYSLDYLDSTDHNGEFDHGVEDGSYWATGYVKFSDVNCMFPYISTAKLLLNDQELQHLVQLTGLQNLEVEMTDDPGAGFLEFFKHPSSRGLTTLVLQIMYIPAQYLQALVDNCTNLQVFKLTGNCMTDSSCLVPRRGQLSQLKQLELRLYEIEMDNSSDEEENPGYPDHSPDILYFFLTYCHELAQLSVHLNCASFMTTAFLHHLLTLNPLGSLQRFALTGPTQLGLDLEAVSWLVESLPSLTSLAVSKWNISPACLAKLRQQASLNNLDIEFT